MKRPKGLTHTFGDMNCYNCRNRTGWTCEKHRYDITRSEWGMISRCPAFIEHNPKKSKIRFDKKIASTLEADGKKEVIQRSMLNEKNTTNGVHIPFGVKPKNLNEEF